jgi:hypothetical protein
MLRALLVATIAAWLGFAAIGAAMAEPIYPQGLRVGLTPPGDVKLSPRFPGFTDPDRRVAISILDLPGGAYTSLEAAAFDQTRTGMQDFKREVFPFESGVGFLISGSNEANGVKLYKWFLLATAAFGSRIPNLTALVTIEVPEAARAVYTDEVVRKALQSVTFRVVPVEEQLGMLPFKLNDLAGFHVAQVLPEGAVILTDGPTDNIDVQPYIIVGIGRPAPSEAADRGRFARDMLTAAPVRDLQIQSGEAMRIGGSPGYEIRAAGKGPSGKALSLVQWVRFGSGGFVRILGVVDTDRWPDLFTRFRTVRDGVDPK